MEALNSPIAVVAILAGCAVLLREVIWGMKSLKGKNRHDPATREIVEVLQEIKVNLIELNGRLERQHEVAMQTHEMVHQMAYQPRLQGTS